MANPFNKETFWESAVPAEPYFLKSLKHCLVLAPHPDDESLGCGGLIALLHGQGCRVSVVLTTDGSKSHPNSVSYPESARIDLRKQELRNALSILGVREQDTHYMNGPDSALPAQGEQGFMDYKNDLKTLLDAIRPQLCLVPYELDPHRDHRASWQVLRVALQEFAHNGIRIWEYPIWLYQNAVSTDIPLLQRGELKYVDIRPYLEQKRTAIGAHVSQVSNLITDDPEGFMLSKEMIAHFLTGREYYMEREKLQHEKTLSDEYFRKLYQKNPDPWDFEASPYEQEKYRDTVAHLEADLYPEALEIGCSIGVLTKLLASKCGRLLSIDVSERALDVARERLRNQTGVSFRKAGIPYDYPEGKFDLVVMSEVGYYLSREDLLTVRHKMVNSLRPGGTLIMVHWIKYVVDYPLTGDQVHELFLAEPSLRVQATERRENYRLNVLIKVGDEL